MHIAKGAVFNPRVLGIMIPERSGTSREVRRLCSFSSVIRVSLLQRAVLLYLVIKIDGPEGPMEGVLYGTSWEIRKKREKR